MVDTYEHTPLQSDDSIRLLTLLPSPKPDEPLRCQLRQVRLGKARSKYEALSYVWGDKDGSRPISCDGRELLVTPNCHDAMVQLRRRYRKRTLWIDAICIDQTPQREAERNHQVTKMGQIYTNASIVIVWLGPEALRVIASIPYILFQKAVLEEVEYVKRMDEDLKKLLELAVTWAEPIQKRFKAFGLKVAEHPWFTRAWTVQVCRSVYTLAYHLLTQPYEKEFAFARKYLVMSGPERISWSCLTWAASLLHNDKEKEGSDSTHKAISRIQLRNDARRLATSKGSYPSYSKNEWLFLRRIGDLDAKLPHDKIYGLYSILKKMQIQLPEPDYSQSIQEVVQIIIKAIVTSTGSLDLITMDLPPTNFPGTQSWIPSYLVPRTTEEKGPGKSIMHSTLLVTQTDRATNRSKAHALQEEASPEKLRVQGKKVAVLGRTMACTTPETGDPGDWGKFPEFVKLCREWCLLCRASPNNRETVQHGLDRWSYTDDAIPKWEDVMCYPMCRQIRPEEVAQYSDPSETNPVVVIINYLKMSPAEVGDFGTSVRSVQKRFNQTAHWAFVFTHTALFPDDSTPGPKQYLSGRAYHTCQEGDQLWLLAGSRVPVVLRPTGVAGDFHYISPAYFYGLMLGERWPRFGIVESLENVENFEAVLANGVRHQLQPPQSLRPMAGAERRVGYLRARDLLCYVHHPGAAGSHSHGDGHADALDEEDNEQEEADDIATAMALSKKEAGKARKSRKTAANQDASSKRSKGWRDTDFRDEHFNYGYTSEPIKESKGRSRLRKSYQKQAHPSLWEGDFKGRSKCSKNLLRNPNFELLKFMNTIENHLDCSVESMFGCGPTNTQQPGGMYAVAPLDNVRNKAFSGGLKGLLAIEGI
ncbi:hypothetical protein PG984_014676 [Apiospora sp. TS-2023a]